PTNRTRPSGPATDDLSNCTHMLRSTQDRSSLGKDCCCDVTIELVIRTRRQWLQAATMWPACLTLQAARKEFWDSKDPSGWSNEEKEVLLGQSPWAREGLVRMEVGKNRRTTAGYGSNGKLGGDMPDLRPGASGSARSVPFGEAPPPVPNS